MKRLSPTDMAKAPGWFTGRDDRPFTLPGRFRPRLVLVFVLVAAVAAGLLAAVTFGLTRQQRYATFARRAGEKAAMAAASAQRAESPEVMERVLRGAAGDGGFDLLVTGHHREAVSSEAVPVGSSWFSTKPGIVPQDLPAGFREAARSERGRHTDLVEIADRQELIVAYAAGDRELYFIFSDDWLVADLTRLGKVLAGGWVLVVLLAAVAGDMVARRTLLPVGQAAVAARQLAQGLLATRLPVRTKDEFGAWATCFNEMAEALEDKIQALSRAHARERRFTSDVAHELRTPLGAMVAAAGVLEEDLERLPADARRSVGLVVSSARRMRRLVLDLLELASLDSGGADTDPEWFRMDDAVRDVVRLSGWQDRMHLHLEPCFVYTDRRRLDRIASNLMANAIEHGRIAVEVHVRNEGALAVLDVRDQGPGIAAQDLPNLCVPFYKADQARNTGGAGLGLALAAENAKLLGATIEIESSPGVCTQFRLRVPRVRLRVPWAGPRPHRGDDGSTAAHAPPTSAAGAKEAHGLVRTR